MVSNLFAILSAFKYAPIASQGKLSYQLTEEEKTRPSLQTVLNGMQVRPSIEQLSIVTHFWDNLERHP